MGSQEHWLQVFDFLAKSFLICFREMWTDLFHALVFQMTILDLECGEACGWKKQFIRFHGRNLTIREKCVCVLFCTLPLDFQEQLKGKEGIFDFLPPEAKWVLCCFRFPISQDFFCTFVREGWRWELTVELNNEIYKIEIQGKLKEGGELWRL